MKKNAIAAAAAGVAILMFSSCGQSKNLENIQLNAMNGTAEIDNSADQAQEIQKEDIASPVDTVPTKSLKGEEPPTINQTETNLYEGEYSDYDANEPALEIKRMNDGAYQIQVTIYRLYYFDDGIGKETEAGLEFTATGPDGNKVNGIIGLEGDIATVTFLGLEWIDFAGLSEYKFYKTSDIPDIYVYE